MTIVTVPFEDAIPSMPRAQSVTRLCELLADPAGERPSLLTGDPIMIVDLDGELPDAAARIRHRACVSVGVHRRGTLLPSGVDDLDVLVTDTETPPRPWVHGGDGIVERIAAGATAQPRAAIALAQLLRLSERLSVHDALVAESVVYSMLLAGPEFRSWLEHRGAPRPAPENDPVKIRRAGRELSISLARPHVHNAYSAMMRDALTSALAIAVADPDIERIVLRGDGPSFCSGGDLREFGTTPDPVTAHVVRVTRSPARLVAEAAQRVVAEVHGACVGAGIELSAFAGRVVAALDAWFQLPEVAMGLVPGAGGTVSLPGRIGRHRTAALALSGDRIDAHQALHWGLVDALR